MSYTHITTFERGRIQELLKLGFSHNAIAKHLGRSRSTIDREISRNSDNNCYLGEIAQERYHKRRKNCRYKGKATQPLCNLIAEKINATWSPEQIANTVAKGRVSTKTIYNWLYLGRLPNITEKNLRHKGKVRHKDRRSIFSMGKPLAERPKEVRSRKTFGHWELDTVVSSRGKAKGCLATFIERKTRLYTAIKIPDRTALSMETAIRQLYSVLPKGAFKTGTCDRGKEFACAKAITEMLGVDIYFADPYRACQRGSNENANGLLREFYPKQTDLGKVSQEELTEKLLLINARPRKCLGWKSPSELFLYEVAHLT